MNKIKDLIYNMNDILVALMILAAAAFIIYWRVGAIMDYPAYAASQKSVERKAESDFTDIDLTPGAVDENLNKDPEHFDASTGENTEPPREGEAQQPAENTEPPKEGESQPPAPQSGGEFLTKAEVKFTIPAGSSCDKIGSLLFQQGLVESKEAFVKEVIAQKADTKLQTGTFTIPAGSNMNDIIKIITR